MTRSRKIFWSIVVLLMLLNIGLHIPGEWQRLSGQNLNGITFLIYLSWNVFASSVSVLSSPAGIAALIGAIFAFFVTQPDKPAK